MIDGYVEAFVKVIRDLNQLNLYTLPLKDILNIIRLYNCCLVPLF